MALVGNVLNGLGLPIAGGSGFVATSDPVIRSAGVGTLSNITGLINAAAGFVGAVQGAGSNDLPPAQQQRANAMQAAGFGFVPQDISTGLVARQSSAAGCGCAPRPSRCDPPFIDRDFGMFGANPCSADPRYPRPSTAMGAPVCAPARKKPRMNPLNPRAAGRAARRLTAAGKAFKRIQKSVKTAERALR